MVRRMLALAEDSGRPVGTADLYRALAELSVEQNDLQTAAEQLQTARQLGEQATLTDWPHRLAVSQAQLMIAQGDLDGAMARLEDAQRQFIPTPLPYVRPIAAQKARLLIAQGRIAEAQDWASAGDFSLADDLNYLSEYEHITLARLLIARSQSDGRPESMVEAAHFVQRLLAAAESGGRSGSLIEILILQALIFEAQGENESALDSLQKALALAEPQGYVRLFAAEGRPLADLLVQAARRGVAPAYVQRLLRAFDDAQGDAVQEQPLPDPLSARELEVLRLLATDLSGPQIADELTVSLNTMRTHSKNIYSKLGVNNRRSAVGRGKALKLI